MASAAAVAANAATSPIPLTLQVNEGLNTVGGITQADHVRASDSDSDIGAGSRQKTQKPKVNEHDEDEDMGDDDDDAHLFGSGSEDEGLPNPRTFDDDELDSSENEARDQDAANADESQPESRVRIRTQEAVDVDLCRVPIPVPSDGEFYLLKIPTFFGIEPSPFSQATFIPPTTDHHSKSNPSSTFSAYNTALTTIRWRHSPSDPAQLQSNARVVRWSDGSLTLQFASRPATHYPISANGLAPPQSSPKKPTPISKPGQKKSKPYSQEQDSFTYIAAPEELAGMLRITNKVTAGLKVQSATDASAEALERLQHRLAAAAGSAQDDATNGTNGISMVRITEDPELAKKKAELAEKEKLKAQKRREAQEQRNLARLGGRPSGGRGLGSGLTIGGLEDDEGLTRLPGLGSSRKKAPRANRRGEIYSDDEEEYAGRGRTREDEYDAEDGFLAPSDEEEEELDDDESESDKEQAPAPRRTPAARQSTPKRRLEDDAEGDLDDTAPAAGSPSAKNKRARRIIEDDDDE